MEKPSNKKTEVAPGTSAQIYQKIYKKCITLTVAHELFQHFFSRSLNVDSSIVLRKFNILTLWT